VTPGSHPNLTIMVYQKVKNPRRVGGLEIDKPIPLGVIP
jgi:hypothetical protein